MNEADLAHLRELIAQQFAAHMQHHALDEKAQMLAAATLAEKLAQLNELRREVTEDRARFVLKETYEPWQRVTDKRLDRAGAQVALLLVSVPLVGVVVGIVIQLLQA